MMLNQLTAMAMSIQEIIFFILPYQANKPNYFLAKPHGSVRALAIRIEWLP